MIICKKLCIRRYTWTQHLCLLQNHLQSARPPTSINAQRRNVNRRNVLRRGCQRPVCPPLQTYRRTGLTPRCFPSDSPLLDFLKEGSEEEVMTAVHETRRCWGWRPHFHKLSDLRAECADMSWLRLVLGWSWVFGTSLAFCLCWWSILLMQLPCWCLQPASCTWTTCGCDVCLCWCWVLCIVLLSGWWRWNKIQIISHIVMLHVLAHERLFHCLLSCWLDVSIVP